MKKIIKRIDKEHYDFSKYVNKDRFMSYYYQLKFIYEIKPKNILEVGCGNKFLKNILKDHFNYKTLDIDSKLNPDYLGNVMEMPLKNSSFDLICCFQVLEHLPFHDFEKSLKELFRVSKRDVLISLPFSKIDLKAEIKLPFLKNKRIKMCISRFYKEHKFDGQHYWEIGKKGYSLKKIKTIIKKYFIIEKIINPYENTYHIFFKMRKK
jgi:ubiquinone/menaquinone biosynthesis C-methylase UbiE